jgi:hypothetical protein
MKMHRGLSRDAHVRASDLLVLVRRDHGLPPLDLSKTYGRDLTGSRLRGRLGVWLGSARSNLGR